MKKLYQLCMIVMVILFVNANNNLATAQENLLVNPGLESGELSPWMNWGGMAVDEFTVHSGNYSMLLNVDPEGGGAQMVFGLEGDATYVLSAWVKGEGVSLACVPIDADTLGLGWIEFAPSTSTTEWELVSDTITIPSNAVGMRFTIWCKSPGHDIFMDDFSLVKLAPENLLANPGLESGELTPWINWGGMAVDEFTVHSGKYSMLLNVDPEGGGPQMVFGLEGDATYVLSAWVLGEGVSLACVPFDADTLGLGWIEFAPSTSTTEWELVSDTITLPSNAVGMRFTIWCKSPGHDIFLDDFSLTKIASSPNTGIKERNTASVKLYPNPAVNELKVSLIPANSKIAIYNSLGKKLAETIVKGSSETTFDVSSFPHGIYFVKVNNNAAQKFIK